MKQNSIILTSGLTGSSVLTGFISQAGYWTGRSTHKKIGEYDTYENSRLIELNQSLLAAAGYAGNYMTEFSPALLRTIENLYGAIDDTPYRQFVAECNEHQPWVWKDPRLWLTIRFWKHLLTPDQCRFILLSRSIWQCWMSALLRRQVRSYGDLNSYERNVLETNRAFVRDWGAASLEVRYDQMIADPPSVADDLNRFLGTELTVKDLQAIYTKPLYTAPKASLPDTVKALLIYAKNYSQRSDTMRGKIAVTGASR